MWLPLYSIQMRSGLRDSTLRTGHWMNEAVGTGIAIGRPLHLEMGNREVSCRSDVYVLNRVLGLGSLRS